MATGRRISPLLVSLAFHAAVALAALAVWRAAVRSLPEAVVEAHICLTESSVTEELPGGGGGGEAGDPMAVVQAMRVAALEAEMPALPIAAVPVHPWPSPQTDLPRPIARTDDPVTFYVAARLPERIGEPAPRRSAAIEQAGSTLVLSAGRGAVSGGVGTGEGRANGYEVGAGAGSGYGSGSGVGAGSGRGAGQGIGDGAGLGAGGSTPAAISFAKPAYPEVARQRGEEGDVLVAVTILADGQLDGISVLSSSGCRRLDEAALRAVCAAHGVPASRGGAR